MANKNTKKGFTLIEALIALTIILLSVGLPMGIIADSILRTGITKQQLEARLLAQEGLEIVRGQRDTNVIRARDWLHGLDSCIENISNNLEWCNLNSVNNFKLFEIFERRIKIKTSDRVPIAAEVFVEVSWTDFDGDEKSIEISEILYQWIGYEND